MKSVPAERDHDLGIQVIAQTSTPRPSCAKQLSSYWESIVSIDLSSALAMVLERSRQIDEVGS